MKKLELYSDQNNPNNLNLDYIIVKVQTIPELIASQACLIVHIKA